MLQNFNPSFVLDLTATPKKESNIISFVDARQLKAENMVKLPVIVYNRKSQEDVFISAVSLRRKLELEAVQGQKNGGKYIRPIVLFQAQPKNNADSTTYEKIKHTLMEMGIPESEIAIKTADKDELKNIDLSSSDCNIRYIITINALKEGWDCPFAYILATVANRTSSIDVEQILGRILRLPNTKKNESEVLNLSYVITSSNAFYATLDKVVVGLNAAGFTSKDYRVEEDGKLISEYSNIKLEESVLFDLICYTLANTSVEIASKYRDYVKKLMHYSEAEFREIVNRVIIPVSEINNHPLGGKLLDEFLRGFDKPAQRDIWWSIPTYLRNNYNASWRTFSELDLSMIALSDKDNYMGKPLILVWRLSSVDNDVRRDCRLKLTEWGINNPYEYLDLLLYCADINDEQIVEDIFAIAYGIALGKFVQKEYLEKLSSWIVENVYSEEGLFKYENSAIRYYCKGIVKIAISKGLCDAECEKRISEKYIRKSSFMPAYKDSFDSKRLSGYGPIDYDLARYVLCDHLDRFFCINYKTREYLRERRFKGSV